MEKQIIINIDKCTLTLAETAKYIGVTEKSLATMCAKRQIPFYQNKDFGHKYFDKKEVDSWMRTIYRPMATQVL